MKHVILTRLSFKDKDLMKKYLVFTKEMLIKSLKSQTCKNFKLILITQEEDDDFLRKELDFPFETVRDNIEFAKYAIDNSINIQTRHDCDDWMSPTYIEKIQELYSSNKDTHSSFLIQSQPLKWMYHQNKIVKLKLYGPLRTSMHLTLCQTDVKHHIHEHIHAQMHKVAKHVIDLGEGYTKWVIHGDNITINRAREKGKKHI